MDEVVLIWRSDYGSNPVLMGFFNSIEEASKFIRSNAREHTRFTTQKIKNLNKTDLKYICYNCKEILNESDTFNSFDETGEKYKACSKCSQLVMSYNDYKIDDIVIEFFINLVKQVCDLYKELDFGISLENLEKEITEFWLNIKNKNYKSHSREIVINRVFFNKTAIEKEERDFRDVVIDEITNIIMDSYRNQNNKSSDSDDDDMLYTNIWNDVLDQFLMF